MKKDMTGWTVATGVLFIVFNFLMWVLSGSWMIHHWAQIDDLSSLVIHGLPVAIGLGCACYFAHNVSAELIDLFHGDS